MCVKHEHVPDPLRVPVIAASRDTRDVCVIRRPAGCEVVPLAIGELHWRGRASPLSSDRKDVPVAGLGAEV